MNLPELKVGDVVKRGPDWRLKLYSNQDKRFGNDGHGTVIESSVGFIYYDIAVRWNNRRFFYRYNDEYQDVVLVESKCTKDNIFVSGF